VIRQGGSLDQEFQKDNPKNEIVKKLENLASRRRRDFKSGMGIPERYSPEGLSRKGMRRRRIVRRNPKHYIFELSTTKRQN
jgi:hypothetical protein